ncbi:uncharacterized protein LOC120990904 [Bufo bufo]|uniref:uncharacterized protein LOC120990904 n=1 Tax=Bufo bufo TaxID=8384 RepID=UPI001ABE6DAA|nr:uncharacterized protein LOC120990904 [Bufo bufo]
MMAELTPLTLASINVASIKSDAARFLAFDFFSRIEADILFLQETWLTSTTLLAKAKREWRLGPSFWSLAAEPRSGVAVLFKTAERVECRRIIELEMGRCLILDVLMGRQELRLINIYGPQSKWDRKCLLMRIKPFLFTSRQVIFGGDFNNVTRACDRGGSKGGLDADSIVLSRIVEDTRLVDAHLRHKPDHVDFTFHQGNRRSRIDRFYLKEEAVFSALEAVEVEFSDHCLIIFSLNVAETPCMGRGMWKLNSSLLEEVTIRQSFEDFLQSQEPLVDLCNKTPCMGRGMWKLNSSLLEEVTIRQSFEDFLQSQEPLVDLCNSKSEWWEIFKKRTARFFRELSNLRSWDRYCLYQELRKKLERLVSTGGSREDISRVKSLLKRCQYDRYASLVAERDFGKYRSPDPFGNCSAFK